MIPQQPLSIRGNPDIRARLAGRAEILALPVPPDILPVMETSGITEAPRPLPLVLDWQTFRPARAQQSTNLSANQSPEGRKNPEPGTAVPGKETNGNQVPFRGRHNQLAGFASIPISNP